MAYLIFFVPRSYDYFWSCEPECETVPNVKESLLDPDPDPDHLQNLMGSKLPQDPFKSLTSLAEDIIDLFQKGK